MSRLLVLALLALAAGAPSALAAEPRASLPDIEDEVMCTICGTTLEMSESPQAERQRALIRRLIGRGLTKEQIKDELVVEYGPEVLAVPADEGFDLAAWLLPIVGLLIAVAGAAIWSLRARRDAEASARRAAPKLTDDERRRLELDLRRYDR